MTDIQPAKAVSKDREARWLFRVGVGFTLIVPMAVSLLTANVTGAWIALLAGAFVTLMSRFNDLAEFSLGPLRARMRDIVTEATATVAQLRDLAVTISDAFLTELMASSFMGGMGFDRRLRIHDDLISKLSGLGATEAQLAFAEEEWRKGVELIYHRKISNEMLKLPAGKQRPTSEHNSLAHRVNGLTDFSTWHVASPSAYQALAKELDLLTPKVSLWIDDFRHFRDTNEIRRRPEFLNED